MKSKNTKIQFIVPSPLEGVRWGLLLFLILFFVQPSYAKNRSKEILHYDDFKCYVDYFNRMEDENIAQAIPNAQAWDWMKQNIPLFDCPQDNFREIYYYRWWTLRKHIEETPVGYAFTEFLVQRSYADKYNLIACAIGHHIMEARWRMR